MDTPDPATGFRSPPGLDDERLARLFDVSRTLVSDLDLEAVLRRVLDAARDLTGAKYAALGVLDAEKRELRRFVFVGIDDATRASIGPLPRGHGILGELIRNPRPLRLAHIGEHPRSYGFPANHPSMTTFAGVPVTIRGEVYGNLYLAEKAGGREFDEGDEQLLVLLAEFAAIGIQNARLYEEAEGRRTELERAVRGLRATSNLNTELSGESDLERALELIAKRGRALVDAAAMVVALEGAEGLVVSASAGELSADVLGHLFEPESPAVEATRSGAARRLGRDFAWLGEAGLGAVRAAMIVPVRHGMRSEGVLIALNPLDSEEFTADDELVLTSFASAAGSGIASVRAIESDRTRLSIVASEQERRRWARELHDETLQELGALKVMLDTTRSLEDPAVLREVIERATRQVERNIDNLGSLITELRPAALDELGAGAAIEALVKRVSERDGLSIELDVDLASEAGDGHARLGSDLEAAIYRIVQEALSNVVKHSGAEHARVAVTENAARVRVTVEDDGGGVVKDGGGRKGFGLLGMRERVEQFDGELDIAPGRNGGTRVTAVLPTGV